MGRENSPNLKMPPQQRTICSLIVFPSSSIVRILKSTPMVEMYDSVYESSANLERRGSGWDGTVVGAFFCCCDDEHKF